MEDNPQVQHVILSMLEKLSLLPTLVSNGEDCIQVYKRAFSEGKPFDFLILDLVIVGGMGAEQTIKQIKQINPNAISILSSGNVMENYASQGFTAQLQKPYSLEELRGKIDELFR